MSWRLFIILQIIMLSVVGGLVYSHKNKVALVKTPPAELANWYKPENKRQVWLHNMFKLRREMQAIAFYAKQKNTKHLKKWTEQLSQHYLKIADMVPSWQKKLDIKTMRALSNASNTQNYSQVITHVETLQRSCDSCHDDYQAITALIYRAPDFSLFDMDKAVDKKELNNNIINDESNENISLHDQMNTLTQQVNQIKISAEDGFTEQALSSLKQLNISMDKLGESCANCHKKDKKAYPNELMSKTLVSLETALVSGSAKDQGQELGTLAVLACARCHGTHRIAYGAKKQLTKKVNFRELIKH